MESFRMVLEDCGLKEIQTDGPWYTWKNNGKGGNEIFEKLDRVVVNDDWDLMFPNAAVSNLASSISDHLPVMLNSNKLLGWQARVKGFKFENFWADNDRCLEVVERCWKARCAWSENIRGVQAVLSDWSRNEYGSIPKSIRHKQSLLKELLFRPDVQMLVNPVTCAIPDKVSELIQMPNREWKVEVIDLLFSKDQGNCIKAIPLGINNAEDQWIWEESAKEDD
ncbi:hypothetical protein ACFE04_019094 [Oxalis oulophora]